MSRMKNLDMRLDEMENWHQASTKTFQLVVEKLDSLLHLMRDMVKLEGKIESMELEIKARLDRMETSQMDSARLVDRLIEMSLVVRGNAEQAAIHRGQSRLDNNNFSNPQAWEKDAEIDEDLWPPPGHTAEYING